MNTIIHMIAVLSVSWLAVEFWDTWNQPILAVTALLVAFFFVIGGFVAADVDWDDWIGGEMPLPGRRRRRRR